MTNSKAYVKKKLYAYLASKWCKLFLGVNKRRKKKLKVYCSPTIKKQKKSIVYGNYDVYKNIIRIYLNNHKTLLEVVQTVIHEYTHYLQSNNQYKKYEKTYYYTQNPFELEAKNNEVIYGKKCLNYIRNQLKISKSGTSLKKRNISSFC